MRRDGISGTLPTPLLSTDVMFNDPISGVCDLRILIMNRIYVRTYLHCLKISIKIYARSMDDIRYSRIRVIYVLRPCVVGFALRNVRYIFCRKMALVVFNIFVAYHNFKTTVRNYSVVRRILLITMFV